jgi:predicted O-methyltransferase YrrM
MNDSGRNIHFDTVDICETSMNEAKINLGKMILNKDMVAFHLNDTSLFMDIAIIQNKKYGFIFVDANHTYQSTYRCALRIARLLLPGGFVLFHDYADRRNFDVDNCAYGVYQAVNDVLLVDERFTCCGIFGNSILFRFNKITNGEDAP